MAKRQKKSKKSSGYQDDADLGSPFANAFAKKFGNVTPVATEPGPVREEEAAPVERSEASDALPAKMILRVQRKGRGGKTVTLAECRGIHLPLGPWLKTLKKKLGVGATLEGEVLVFQGDIRERLAGLLEAEGVKKIVQG